MNYNEAFKGYNVPENIKNAATKISIRFAIEGICDPMYIANTIGVTCGIGDGRGNFTTGDIKNSLSAAEHIQFAYGCNILKSETEEVKNIIDTGDIDTEKANKGMKAFIKRVEDEKRRCDSWRIDYLNRQIETLNTNIKALQI